MFVEMTIEKTVSLNFEKYRKTDENIQFGLEIWAQSLERRIRRSKVLFLVRIKSVFFFFCHTLMTRQNKIKTSKQRGVPPFRRSPSRE